MHYSFSKHPQNLLLIALAKKRSAPESGASQGVDLTLSNAAVVRREEEREARGKGGCFTSTQNENLVVGVLLLIPHA